MTPERSTQVLDHLASVTGQRDRDSADAALVAALGELLDADRVGLYRIVEEAGQRRWFTQAEWRAGDTGTTADLPGVPIDALTPLAERPIALAVLTSGEQLREPARPASWAEGMQARQPAQPARMAFPLGSPLGPDTALEIVLDDLPEPPAQALLEGVLRVYAHFVRLLGDNERDTLTGLLNRKTFDESFYRLAALTLAGVAEEGLLPGERRHGAVPQRHFLGVVDIDHFKSVNDRFGHLIGDEVLLLLSRLMRQSFRFDDLLFRFGGEEFVVLMRCGSDADASRALERLRRTVAAHDFPQVGRITISVGYTQVGTGDSPNIAFDRADKAVYWAKSHGRDQVCSHAVLVAEGHLAHEAKVGDVELF